jgi:hypothetical protein
MKSSYTLLDYYGKPWTGTGAGTYTNYSVNQPHGIFSIDGLSGDKNARTKLLGSIAYVRGNDRFAPSRAIYLIRLDSVEVVDTTVYIQPGTNTNKQRFSLNNLITGTASNLIARKLTGVGGANSYYGSNWKRSSISEGSSLNSVANVYTSTAGANLCKRYQNRVLTSVPLWPWPMNQRIINAMIESGRAAVDVTKTIESILGPIPSACKSTTQTVASTSTSTSTTTSSTPLPVPSSPVNLQAGQ